MRTNNRVMFALGALVCAALLGFAYYLQYVQNLQPCPLCMVQRGFFYLVFATFALGAVHGPKGRLGSGLYAAFIVFFAAGGAATATRQVWLQHLPSDKVPACGPDLFFMLENFPLARTLEKLFYGSGECATVDWKFLGLSIAGWSLVWFVILGAYALWVALRTSRTAAAAASP
jgi:protein dithiol:quinone oxidoreductase